MMKRKDNFKNTHATKKMDKKALSQFKKDPENFEYYEYILSEDFVREYRDVVDWYSVVGAMNELSEDFVIEMKKYIKKDVMYVLHNYFYDFSERFVETFKNKIFWDRINYDNLSEKFIEKNLNKVDWDALSYCKIAQRFVKLYPKKINYEQYIRGNFDELSETEREDAWWKANNHDKLTHYYLYSPNKIIRDTCRYYAGKLMDVEVILTEKNDKKAVKAMWEMINMINDKKEMKKLNKTWNRKQLTPKFLEYIGHSKETAEEWSN